MLDLKQELSHLFCSWGSTAKKETPSLLQKSKYVSSNRRKASLTHQICLINPVIGKTPSNQVCRYRFFTYFPCPNG